MKERVDVILTRTGGGEIIDATFRRARSSDVGAMHELSKPFVAAGQLIERDIELFDASVEDFHVVEIDHEIAGCAGIRRFGGLAEIFNVAVGERWQGLGLGRFLLASMLIVLAEEGFSDALVFTRTTRDWFARHGFAVLDASALPAERIAMIDPERESVPMTRPTVRGEDGVDVVPQLAGLRVKFAASGVELDWDGRIDSLLPFAEKNGIEVDSLCWGGVCGTCSTKLTCGTVSYHLQPEVTPPNGEVLLCIARPVTDLVLDL
ncbi:GNAT family N-acetyltransferase [Lentzea sp. NPDC004782]|uniref:GNAT family N-acetyltransferase n=1 Tax=Lentzea sp. NPDC004782 TaxID=3154458 RepID=UPI0033B746E8